MSNTQALEKLGKYNLLEKVGEGGFGIVYRGRDPFLERDVAIKILRSELAAAPDFLERFKREARLAASLNHPNIVHIIEVGEQDGYYYLVMDYLAGDSLASYLQDDQPMALSRVIEILEPIANALDYAHSRHIIHRDVKPSNILFTEEGRPMLADFGLVRDTHEAKTTTTGIAIGSPEYMSPEQIQGQEVSPAADRYALAVVAYQMLCGQAPFRGKSPFEIQSGHVNQPPPDPRTQNPAMPQEITQILLHALVKEPSQRYTSGKEFVSALQQVLMKIIQQEASVLEREAQQAMDARNFGLAITRLQEILAVQANPQAEELIKECQVREQILNEFNDLNTKQQQCIERINKLAQEHAWLGPVSPKRTEDNPLGGSSPPKQLATAHAAQVPHQASKTGYTTSLLLGFAVFITVITEILALIIIFYLLSHYPDLYTIIEPGFAGFLLGVSLLLWVIFIVNALKRLVKTY